MTTTTEETDAIFVGENLALDFINTAYGVDNNKHDLLIDDMSVLKWLKKAGVEPTFEGLSKKLSLLESAIELRSLARTMINKRWNREQYDPKDLNRFLSLGDNHMELQWEKGKEPMVINKKTSTDVTVNLVPVAESLAQLLSEHNFEQVKQCECPDCTLLFLDRTKSGRRRWCSMAMCGNKMKVAAFRARKKD